MTPQTIAVRPIEAGWSVTCTLAGEPMMFLSASAAEAKARALALRVAGVGCEVHLHVHDNQDALVGTLHYYGED